MATIVVASDGEKFVLEKDVAAQCGMIADFTSGGSTEEIPLLNVSSAVMRKVIAYCEHHRNDTVSEQVFEGETAPRRQSDEWDKEFMIMDQEMLFALIIAANYLNIKPLLDLGCGTVANMIKGKTPEEIRKLFNIINNATPEE